MQCLLANAVGLHRITSLTDISKYLFCASLCFKRVEQHLITHYIYIYIYIHKIFLLFSMPNIAEQKCVIIVLTTYRSHTNQRFLLFTVLILLMKLLAITSINQVKLNLFSTNIPYMEHHFHELTIAQWFIIFGIINALLH